MSAGTVDILSRLQQVDVELQMISIILECGSPTDVTSEQLCCFVWIKTRLINQRLLLLTALEFNLSVNK